MLNAQLAPDTRPTYYVDSSTGKRFLLDRTGPHALLQYENDDEVFALRSSNGPRGDQFYRTDTGRVFLRITELGNVIVFPLGDRQGAPASLDAAASAIIPPLHPQDFVASLQEASDSISRSLNSSIDIRVDSGLHDYGDWTMEAVDTALKGITRAKKRGHSRISQISFDLGEAGGLSFDGRNLSITIAPADGFAGRPSSEAIARVLVKAK